MVKSHGLAVGALLAWALCAAQPAVAQDPVDGVCQDDVRNTCTAGTPNDDAVPDSSSAYLWRCDGLNGGQNSRICFVRLEDVVDGVCDESVRNGCSAGTPNPAAYPDQRVAYQWRCDGQGGGQNSRRCALWFSVDGVCDESVRNGCSAGTANDDAFPDTSTEYAWRCDGWNAGANSARCSRHVPVNGVCDDSARNACSAGTPNDDAFADTSNAYLWRCDGLHGGTNSDKCHVFKPVNGVCDDSVRNGCAAGTPNDDAFPDAGSGGFVWRCDGEHGGRNSEKCFVRSVNGVCDDGVRNSCSAGTPNDDAFADTSNAYLWRCDGLHGGTNSDKCHMFIPVNGVCDESVRNGCLTGTANADAVPDSVNAHLWRCDGLHGGRNSEKCFTYKAVDGVCDESVRNGCSAGTANDDAIADTSSAYLWRCDGLHGGANSQNCSKAMAVDGACDESVRNGCSAGTANDGAVADTTSHYRWRCDGSEGGSNSGVCSAAKPVTPVSCGTASWSPATSTVCSGQSFTQTRTCNAGCNTGDCSTSRSATGTKSCVRCGAAWSPAASSFCSGHSFTQTRTCNAGCNTGDCATSRNATGTQSCELPTTVVCGTAPWTPAASGYCPDETVSQTRSCNPGCNTGDCSTSRSVQGTKTCVECGDDPWDPAPETVCKDKSFTQERSCNSDCNVGDCSTSQQNTGTKPCPCECTAWSTCSPNACGASGRQTRTCNEYCAPGTPTSQRCTGNAPRNCQWTWSACACTSSSTDAASAGTRSRTISVTAGCGGTPCPPLGSPQPCTVVANNCPVSCGASWPSSPTRTVRSTSHCEGGYCEYLTYDVYERDCAAGCNDGDCNETRQGNGRHVCTYRGAPTTCR